MNEQPENEQPTCGRGLADHSMVPAKIAELLASLTENLEAHIPSIDVEDPNGRAERDAYEKLAADYRAVASGLRAAARQMAGYRDLPMARHHEAEASARGVLASFRRYVEVERQLVELLRDAVSRDQHLLDAVAHRASESAGAPP